MGVQKGCCSCSRRCYYSHLMSGTALCLHTCQYLFVPMPPRTRTCTHRPPAPLPSTTSLANHECNPHAHPHLSR